MRIVIVGGGISGLACYLFLQKHLSSIIPKTTELKIIIVESHAATRRQDRSGSAVDEAAGPVANTIGAALGLGRYHFHCAISPILLNRQSLAQQHPMASLFSEI